jgi:hypothetical protein
MAWIHEGGRFTAGLDEHWIRHVADAGESEGEVLAVEAAAYGLVMVLEPVRPLSFAGQV